MRAKYVTGLVTAALSIVVLILVSTGVTAQEISFGIVWLALGLGVLAMFGMFSTLVLALRTR